ncbi:hypothetical protein KIPB_001681 [Kipferlia bialata]|uniref:Uncharacterized protein n=1 Tax=Kipferlia bialata TaxID=797122 RepID=A0A391NJP0_9EUKA|nr:hypothetical protein KIPB_001681 [Kipferlia bialata]|eukprot:g1681.t1
MSEDTSSWRDPTSHEGCREREIQTDHVGYQPLAALPYPDPTSADRHLLMQTLNAMNHMGYQCESEWFTCSYFC